MRLNKKRLFLSIIFGFCMGLICYYGGILIVKIENNITNFLWIILNRVMIGFVIGISILRIHWLLHGAMIGAIIGALFPFYIFIKGGDLALIIIAYGLSIIFGMLIEFFTSYVFKQNIVDI